MDDNRQLQLKATPLVITLLNGPGGHLTTDTDQLFHVLWEACLERNADAKEAAASLAPKSKQDHLLSTNFLTISVVGPLGSGKSFLLNWVATYLRAYGVRGQGQGQESSKWMWTMGLDPKANMLGFSWNPYAAEDLDAGSGVGASAANTFGGIRVMRDLPTLTLPACGTPGLKVLLLDVDMPDRQDPDFLRKYTALTATCILISNVTIYLDCTVMEDYGVSP